VNPHSPSQTLLRVLCHYCQYPFIFAKGSVVYELPVGGFFKTQRVAAIAHLSAAR